MRRLLALVAVICVALVLLLSAPAVAVRPPPAGADVDYQLGGTRAAPERVRIVVRDRAARPAPGRYNICYVNGFQTQPGERALWRRHADLVLRDHGRPVLDEAWGEALLDVRTAAKRQRLAAVVGRWTRGCARAGYDAVEYDNLDSFTRSRGLLSRAQAIAYARLLVGAAHRAGLAAGQKNLAGFDGTTIGYDFAVAEECGRYDECGRYVRSFGDHVLAIEYRHADLRRTCAQYGERLSVVLRDRDLSPTGVRRWC